MDTNQNAKSGHHDRDSHVCQRQGGEDTGVSASAAATTDRWRILFDGSSSYSSILSWSCNGGVVRVGPVGLSVTSSSHGGIAFSVLFFKYASGGTPVGRTLAVW